MIKVLLFLSYREGCEFKRGCCRKVAHKSRLRYSKCLFCYRRVSCWLFMAKCREVCHRQCLLEAANGLPIQNHKSLSYFHAAGCSRAWGLCAGYRAYAYAISLGKLAWYILSLSSQGICQLPSNFDKGSYPNRAQGRDRQPIHQWRSYRGGQYEGDLENFVSLLIWSVDLRRFRRYWTCRWILWSIWHRYDGSYINL